MPLGVAQWRTLLAPWHAQLQVALPPNYSHLVNHSRFPRLPIAPWRDFVRQSRELAELVHTLAIVEQVSLADALRTLALTSREWLRLPPPLIYLANGDVIAKPERSLLVSLGHDLIGPQANRDNTDANAVELAAIYFAFDARSASAAFRTTMETVYAALTPAERSRLCGSEPLELSFTFSMRRKPRSTPAALYVRSIGDLALRLLELAASATQSHSENNQDPHWQLHFPFTLTKMHVMDIDELSAQAPDVSAALTHVLALGVQSYESLQFGPNSWFLTSPLSHVAPVVQGLVDVASVRSALGVERRLPATGGSQTLQLHDYRSGSGNAAELSERAQLRQLGAVLSAFTVARDVQVVTMRLSNHLATPEGGERFLKWLTYALFSKDAAASSVTSLEIDIGFRPEDAAGITRVLEARNPAEPLLDTTMVTLVAPRSRFPSSRGRGGRGGRRRTPVPPPGPRTPAFVEIIDDEDEEDRDLGFAVVEAGTSIAVKPLDGDPTPDADTFVLPTDGQFRVMRDASGSDYVDIVVPSYGHCVVARASVAHFALSLAPDASVMLGYHGALTSLKLKHYENTTALLPLVVFVGPRLLELEIAAEVTNADVAWVVQACPNLRSLTLSHTVEEVDDVLIPAYASGQCRIERLALDGFFVENDYFDGQPSTRFLLELQDPASRAAQTLRELVLYEARPSAIDMGFLTECTRMLTVNRTLNLLSFSVLDELFEVVEPVLMATNGMMLPPRPLELAQKYAFLSVVRHFSASGGAVEPPRKRFRQTTGAGRGRSAVVDLDLDRFDPLVASLIFEFAARPGGTRCLQISGYDGENTPPEW